ncbi:MAG TPA: alpha/beta hydrolase [Pyrinomonadaceae bacterium]|nr:alpha/beta hydrolase [Pyrinomonadaceae bacterium]
MKFKVNGTILNVFEAGVENYKKTRPPLVFLHYFGGSSRAWTEVIEHLAKDYHCVAPDLRGFGASDSMPENYAVKDYADDVECLIATLTIENCVLVGHSMGGKIALALAARKPKNLQSLILLAPSPPTAEPMKESERKKLLAAHGNRCVATETVCKAAGGKLPGKIFARAIDDNLLTSETAWKWWLKSGSREDVSAEIKKINVPVLVAAGEKDEAMTPELLKREIVCRIENARLFVVPDGNHLLPLDSAAAVVKLIRDNCENHFNDNRKSFDTGEHTENIFDGGKEKHSIKKRTTNR